ncbi:MAG: energy-coupling factor transporter transmembrane component T family protein, partial [cyanobacterium endosymbiont of Rhopalodia yunnanensis]
FCCLNLLVLTTAVPELFEGLLSLGISPLFVAIMASMYRYIDVLVRKFTTMKQANLSRNLRLNTTTNRLITWNIISSLLIRTYERGKLSYQAMLARGYQGLSSKVTFLIYKKQDKLAFVVTAIIIFYRQLLY